MFASRADRSSNTLIFYRVEIARANPLSCNVCKVP